jgi:transposase-like protein
MKLPKPGPPRYLRYALSYRDLEEIERERGLPLDHTTIYRWGEAPQTHFPTRTKELNNFSA